MANIFGDMHIENVTEKEFYAENYKKGQTY